MVFIWKRSVIEKFSLIYHEFSLSNNGEQKKYRIEDLQRDRFEEVLKLMREKHLIDEPMYSSKGVRDDPVSFQEMTENWQNMLNQKISLVCFEEESVSIIAINVLGVVTEEEFDRPHNFQGKGWAEVNNLKKLLKAQFFDPFKHYQVDKIMFAAGLYVNETFRNRGIAVEMLKARQILGKAIEIQVTSNVFSSLAAQKAAIRAGYEESFCMKYSELPKLTEDGHFPGIKDEFMKIMSKKFSNVH